MRQQRTPTVIGKQYSWGKVNQLERPFPLFVSLKIITNEASQRLFIQRKMILKSQPCKSDKNQKVKLAQHIIFIAQAYQNWSRWNLLYHVVTFEPDALEQKFLHHRIPHNRISLYAKFGQYWPLWTKCSTTPLNESSRLILLAQKTVIYIFDSDL